MYKTKAHSKFSLLVHLVFVTKYRDKWLSDEQNSNKELSDRSIYKD